MAPIRIGLIGLSAAGSWASQAHLPYLKATSKYTIVALCNTSVESARAAISAHDLPSSTKAYGSYKDLAGDPDVDLVVCSVRVDRHYDALMPALEAGKDCFSEWPLGKNLDEGLKLAELAKKKGVRTMVGLQARQSAATKKIREIVDSGRIGKVLSVTWVGAGYNLGPTEMEQYAYLNDKEVGGNLVTIHFSHGKLASRLKRAFIRSSSFLFGHRHKVYVLVLITASCNANMYRYCLTVSRSDRIVNTQVLHSLAPMNIA